jgi:hypothetical protein
MMKLPADFPVESGDRAKPLVAATSGIWSSPMSKGNGGNSGGGKSGGNGGGGNSGQGNHGGHGGGGWPSTTGNQSGGGRTNAPPGGKS